MTDCSRDTYFTFLRLGVLTAGIIGLAACGTTAVDEITEPEIEELETAAPAVDPLPLYVEGKGYADLGDESWGHQCAAKLPLRQRRPVSGRA